MSNEPNTLVLAGGLIFLAAFFVWGLITVLKDNRNEPES